MLAKMQYFEFTQVCVCNATGSATCFSGPNTSGSPTTYTTGNWQYQQGFRPDVAGLVCNGLELDNNHILWSGTIHIYLYDQTAGTTLKNESHTLVTIGPNAGTVLFTSPQALTSGHTYVIGVDLSSGTTWEYWAMANVSANSLWTPMWGGVQTLGTVGIGTNQSQPWWHMGPQVCTVPSPTPPPSTTGPTQPTTITLPPGVSCSTTADLCAAINRIDQTVRWLYQLVTLQQRNLLPYAYIAGTVHTGLTNSGTISIQGLLGFRVTAAGTPTNSRTLEGNPSYLWNMGWMAIEEGASMIEEKRITRSTQEWLPRDCSLATTWSYFAPPGVTLTMTELKPEP